MALGTRFARASRDSVVSRESTVARRASTRHVVKCCDRSPKVGEWSPNGVALGMAALFSASILQLAPVQEQAAIAALTAGDPIKSASAILRYALPIENKPIRQVQRELESISEALRIPGSKSLGPVQRSVRSAESIITNQAKDIVAGFAPDKKEQGLKHLEQLATSLAEFQAVIDAKDKQAVPIKQREALEYVGLLEQDMVQKFPFEVPSEYANLPQLRGRAELKMQVSCRDTVDGPKDVVLKIVVDGYNAPISAGNFVDLVERGFYDKTEIQRADGLFVQFGDPEGPAEGFVDSTGEVRRIPFEVKVKGDKEPVYDFTLEDLGRYNETPVLPFNAFGTLAVARAEFENNSGSSQMFFLLKESELTPTGANLLDGRYAVFGYIVEGQDAIKEFKVGDKINSVKVVSGAENLINGGK